MPEVDQSDEFQAAVEKAAQAKVDAELAGLKSALAKTKEEKNKAKERLAELDGIDPGEFARLKTESEKREAERLKAAGEWDVNEKALRSKYETELAREREATSGKFAAMEQQLHHELVESRALQAMAENDVKEVVGLKPHILRHLKMVEEDGKYRTDVVDEKGDPMFVDGTSDRMSTADLVKWMGSQKEYAWAFRGTGSAGGDASGNAAGSQGDKFWVGNKTRDGAEII